MNLFQSSVSSFASPDHSFQIPFSCVFHSLKSLSNCIMWPRCTATKITSTSFCPLSLSKDIAFVIIGRQIIFLHASIGVWMTSYCFSLISSFNLCLEMACLAFICLRSNLTQEGRIILSLRTTKDILESDLNILECELPKSHGALECDLPKFHEFHVDWDLWDWMNMSMWNPTYPL